VLAGAARYLPYEEARGARRVDLAGVSTLSAAVLLVVVPLVLGRAEGWPAWTWLSLAASVPAFAGFGAAERRVRARRRASREPRRDLAAGRVVGHARRCGRHQHVLRAALHARALSPSSRGSVAARSCPG
jgi:hypothetical protein